MCLFSQIGIAMYLYSNIEKLVITPQQQMTTTKENINPYIM